MGSRLDKNSKDVSKRIQNHSFDNEDGEEYEASKFGGFTDYMRRKKRKLQNLDAELRSQSTDKPQIFRGVVAQVNGYTQPSLSDLHVLIVSHGGGFLQYLDGKTACTHIIASQLTPKKKAEFARYRIVKPAWVVDSVRAGRLLPWDNYRVVDEGVTQKVLGFDGGQITSQVNNQRQSYRAQSDTSWYMSQVKDAAQEFNNNVGGSSGDTSSRDMEKEAKTSVEDVDRYAIVNPDEDVVGDADTNELDMAEEVQVEDLNYVVDGSELPIANDDVSANTIASLLDEGSSLLQTSELKSPQKRQLTAEEHNATLLQNPHMAKSSTANPDFLNQYYRESRLHHLSTWKAELKAQLQARAQEKSSSQQNRHKRAAGVRRYVMHVDFDSFFAAVSLRKQPHLIDKPVVIAHGSGPGSEIASCNYPARKYGVKNGMWMKTALEMCPVLKVLPYDFKAYEEASRHFYDSILAMDGLVQSISIDEALIDVSKQCVAAGGSDGKGLSESSIIREQAKANGLAQDLRKAVRDKTGCEVSVGIGGNILLAKVALRKAKPAGQYLIKPEEILDFIGELTVTDLPGVAYSLAGKLEEIGVKYVKDIRNLNKERLVTTLGPKTGEKLWDYSRGIDKVEVGEQNVRQSVSAEVNWGIRFVTQQQAEDFVQSLCDELHKRLLENAVKGRHLTMKIMRKAADAGLDPPKNLGHGKCDTFNKSVVLGVSTNDKAVLGKEAISVLRGYGFPPGELRGLGVQMKKLEPLKPAASANASVLDSSQRRLQFQKPGIATATATPTKTDTAVSSKPVFTPASPTTNKATEQIEEVPTPEKPRHSSTIVGALDQGVLEDDRPLNISGTQFFIPSQIDPEVLAELPADIRSKLVSKQKSILESVTRSDSPGPGQVSRSASPFLSDSEYALPSQSQLDPTTLAELPDDVKEELLAHYRNQGKPSSSRRNQQLLPQSPRKARPIMPSKKTTLTPTKKHRFSSIASKSRFKTKTSSTSTLTQSNFVSMARSAAQADPEPPPDQEISKSFLEELPDDIRLELLAEQKRNRMKSKSGLNVGTSRRRAKEVKADVPRGQQKLQMPSRPEKPTFTSRKLSDLPDLRDAMSAWVQEFSGEDGEGPFQEDATALGHYLRRVILEEEDMAKAVSVIEWLAYIVDDWPFDRDSIRLAWTGTIDSLRGSIQEAVTERGLPPVEFSMV